MLIHGATDNDIHPALFGAAQRSFGLYRGLARRYPVRVLCLVPNRTQAPQEERVEGVTLARRKAWYTSAAWRFEQAGLLPFFVAARGHRANAARLLEALPGHPDVLAADLNLCGLLEAREAPLRVYTSHNLEYDHFRMVKARVVAAGWWAERIRRLEARAVERADLTVVCAEEDAGRMNELYGAGVDQVTVVPNGFDETRITAPTPATRARAREALGVGDREYLCLFLGSDTSFNREGLRALRERVLPALAADGFRLLVVGGITRSLGPAREPWLIVREETAQLSPLLEASDAGLNPVHTGGGSNVKLPTYLGAGLAVVSTEFGLRGYATLRPWVTVAEPECMAEALRERPLGWAARGLPRPAAIEEFAWGRLGERLGEVFEARLGARSAARDGRVVAPAPAAEPPPARAASGRRA